MTAIEIRSDVYWIGVNDRTTDLFEGLWPITHEGISYNAYFIDDEKKAVIDLSKSSKNDEFFDQITEIADISKIDYVVVNHMEPDHSGLLNAIKQRNPQVAILGTKKTKDMLNGFYGITDNVKEVQDGETLSLGKRTLKFVATPFVHWPETMMTFETSHEILFSCDGFGGYGALRGSVFDDECKDLAYYEQESLRYFANIVARFSRNVINAIKKLADTQIRVVAPSHGLIWRQRPGRIIELYQKWSGYASGEAEAGVTLLYGSMYGNTEQMMNAVAQGISRTGLVPEIFDAARIHPSYILSAMWINQGIMVGAPTYEVSLFPPVAHALDIAVHKGVRNRMAARFGSYGWSGGAQREFEKIIEAGKWQLTDSFEFMGGPTRDDLKKGEAFGRKFGETIKNTAPGKQ